MGGILPQMDPRGDKNPNGKSTMPNGRLEEENKEEDQDYVWDRNEKGTWLDKTEVEQIESRCKGENSMKLNKSETVATHKCCTYAYLRNWPGT